MGTEPTPSDNFGPEAFNYLLGLLASSTAVTDWGLAVFDTYVGQTSHTSVMHVNALIETLDITSKTRVLELGSGSGGIGCYIAAQTGCELEGVDWSDVGVLISNERARAQGLADKVRFYIGDLRNLHLPSAAYDVVFSIDATYFNIDYARLATTISHVLRDDRRFGTLITMPRAMIGVKDRKLVSSLPSEEDITAAFASAGLVGQVVMDLTTSYTDLVRRMLQGWLLDLPALQQDLGRNLANGRLIEDECLLTMLETNILRRILYIAQAVK